jgi:hypothetical protein
MAELDQRRRQSRGQTCRPRRLRRLAARQAPPHAKASVHDPDRSRRRGRASLIVPSRAHRHRAATMTVEHNQELWLGGHLWEHDDTSEDDDMGGHYEHWPYDIIPGAAAIAVAFHDRSGTQNVEAIFEINVESVSEPTD